MTRGRDGTAGGEPTRKEPAEAGVAGPPLGDVSHVRLDSKTVNVFTKIGDQRERTTADRAVARIWLAALPPCYREEVAGHGSDQNVSVVRSFTRNPFGSRTGGAYVLLSATR